MTEFIKLTDLWYQGDYNQVGNIIKNENWDKIKAFECCQIFCFQLLKKFDIFPT